MNDSIFSQKWSAGSLLRFALPTVAMMALMGVYTVTDTIFVSRLVNTDALSAINIVSPLLNLTVGLGTMLATGGGAIISRNMGAGRLDLARQDLTLLVITGGAAGAALSLGCGLWLDRLLYALGASSLLFPYCRAYLAALLPFLPANMLQTLFANLLVTAGRPGLGFGASALAGAANILLDYILIRPCGLDIRGAALGTGLACLIPAGAGLVCFSQHKGTLFFARPRLRWRVIGESCFNGSSEMVSQLAAAVTTFLFNRTMMDLLGEDGVAAVTIMIYAQFLLSCLYIGFSMGVAPVIGFNYGSGDAARQRRVFSICIRFILGASAVIFALSWLGGPAIAGLFASRDSAVFQIAAQGLPLFACSFLFSGVNIFTSAMFTALSNGRLSALLSFLRTFGLLAGGILLLPRLWGVAGVWLAVPAAEGIMCGVSAVCLVRFRRGLAD